MMNDEQAFSRRRFLQRLSLIGAASLGAGSVLAACGGGEQQTTPDTGMEDAGAAQTTETGFSCDDTSGLTDAEIQARQNLQYVDQSPNPDRHCQNCNFWQPPAEGTQCGGCQILKGPIHPEGYCNSWVAKQQTG